MTMPDATGIGCVSRVIGKIAAVQDTRAEKLKVPVRSDSDHDRPIARMKQLIGNDRRMRIAKSPGVFSCEQDVLRDIDQRRGCLLSLLSLPIEHRQQIADLFCYPAERLGLFHEGPVVILPNENLFGGLIEPLEILSKLFAQRQVEIADHLMESVD